MKERRTKKHNQSIILTITVTTLMMAAFTGCSKEPATNEVSNASKESKVETKTEETEKAAEGEGVTSEAAAEPTPEAAPETIPEPVVYEGIDMESDLPGEEWVKTFIGVVDEPVVIIYNDSTGRKEIVQEGATVNVNPDEDKFAIYLPDGTELYKTGMPMRRASFTNYAIAEIKTESVKEGTRINAKVIVKKGEEEIITTFKVIIE